MQSTTFGPSEEQLAIYLALQNVPTPSGQNPLAAANVQFVLQNSSNAALNEINNSHPLTGALILTSQPVLVSEPTLEASATTKAYVDAAIAAGGVPQALNIQNQAAPLSGNLDFSTSSYHVQGIDPIAPQDMAIKSWVQDQISHYTPTAIEALGDATTRTNMAQSGRFTYFQGILKEGLMNGLTTDYQPRRYDQDYQIIDPNQLVTYSQTVLGVEEEKKERIAADEQLQSNINAVLQTPLNQWPTPMTPGILGNTFEMNGNQISGLGIQPQGSTPAQYASSVDYVNQSVNNLGFTLGGQISNVKVQCETYTDESVLELKSYTDNQLRTKQDIVPLNEIPLPEAFVSMNGHTIRQLADPYYLSDALSLGYADLRYLLKSTPLNEIAAAEQNVNLNGNKLTGLLAGTQGTDAINWAQLQEYITIQNASDAFRSRISTLSDIQAEEPAALNMRGYAITGLPDPIQNQEPVTLAYFNSHSGPSGVTDEIHNTSGFTSVKCNSDQTISLKANETEAMSVQGSLIAASVPIFSLTVPAGDPSNQLLTKSQLDPYYLPADTPFNEIYNAGKQSSVLVDEHQHTVFTNNGDEVFRIEPTLLLASQPVFSTAQPAFDSSNQLLTRGQLDPLYIASGTPLNDISAPNADVNMNGFTLNNLSDPVSNLQATNKAYVDNAIANSGFKNKIVSQNNHAQVVCQPNDEVHIRANNATTDLVVSSDGINTYSLTNNGQINVNASVLNINDYNVRILGTAAGGTVLLAGDLRSSATDLGYEDQILTRLQNDGRYAPISLSLSSIQPPTSSVSFGGQLLRNLQSPVLNADASTKYYVDQSLLNYLTTGAAQSIYLTKTDASLAYLAKSTPLDAIQPPINNVAYNSKQITGLASGGGVSTNGANIGDISSALVPYLTSSTAASTYQPQSTPFTSVSSNDQLNRVICNAGLNGIDVYASNAGVSNKICTISQPASYPQSVQFVSPSRIFLTSGTGSMSFYSSTGQKTNSIYIGSSADSTTEALYDQVVIGNGRSTAPQLTLSSGHSASNIPYSIICNGNTTSLNNLQLSPEISSNVLSGNALNMYASGLISSFPILNQFTGPTGRSSTQSSAQPNEFITRAYADSHYSGGGTPASIIDSGANNSVTCSAGNPGIVLTNLKGTVTGVQFGSATSLALGLSFVDQTGYIGGLSAIGGGNYLQYTSNNRGFKFQDNAGNVYQTLKSAAQATSDGTSQVIFIGNPQVSVGQSAPASNELIQKQYADSRYTISGITTLNSIAQPTTAYGFNAQQLTNLASGGTITGTNTNAINASDLFNYVTNAAATSQTWTITLSGSSSTGISWANIPANYNTTYCQTQKVKGAAGNLITSATVGAVSTTLASSWALFDLQMASNVRITQAWCYNTTPAGSGSQQNAASITYCQQASSTAGHSTLQLYKPATTQGSDSFIVYFTVDSF